MRVAILDSGVTANHPHIGGVVEGIAITPYGTEPDYVDWLGHGTAVAAAIHEKAPRAELLIVKIFGRRLNATVDQLVRGIEWGIEQQADFINLSLGTQNENHCERLRPVVDRAAAAGCTIVSARRVGDSRCFPGSMSGVLGVEADPALPRDEIRLVEEYAFGSPYPRPIPGVPPEKNLHGISFAVANVTGYLCGQVKC